MNVISKGFDTIALHLPAEKGGGVQAKGRLEPVFGSCRKNLQEMINGLATKDTLRL
jgi:hypothetical protein